MSSPRWFDHVVTLPLRRPRMTICAALVVTILALLAWPLVRFEPDISRVLPADHPHVRIAQLLDDRSRPARVMWLLLRGEGLPAKVPALAETLRSSPQIVDVASTRSELFSEQRASFEQAPLWQLDDRQLAALAARLSADGVVEAASELAFDLADDPIAAREIALRDPLGLRWVLSDADPLAALGFDEGTDLLLLGGGARALLQIRGAEDAFDADFATELCAFVDRELEAADVEADVFGGYAVARADQRRIKADFERASTWSVLAIAIYLCWVMRGVRLPLLVQLPAMLSILWAIPFGAFCFGALPTVAVAAVAVLCGLGVDFAIHYAARYRHARLRLPHRDAVREVQRTTVPELLIDMMTTAVTFLAIGAGTEGGLRAFGLLLALGLVGSVLFTIFALPVLLRWAGDRPDPERSALASAADSWLARRTAPRAAWGAIAIALLGVGYLLVAGIELSAEAEAVRPKDDPVAAARRTIEQQVGFSTVPVLALWPDDVDASPLHAALADLRERGEVRFWSGLDRRDTQAGRVAVAACREQVAGFVGRASAAFDEEGLQADAFRPALDELARRLERDGEPAAAKVVAFEGRPHRAVSLWASQRLDRAAFFELQEQLVTAAGDEVVLHGGPTLTAALEEMLVRDLQRACWIAALLAVGMVTWWLRSLRLGLLALVPSVLGLVVTLVLLRLFGIPLSMISFVSVPFVLGIGVDEGVHLVGHFRHGASDTGATGVGIVRTSVGTVLGFSSLLLAATPGLQLLGGVVAFGSMACMLSCLFVLAPLLARTRRAR